MKTVEISIRGPLEVSTWQGAAWHLIFEDIEIKFWKKTSAIVLGLIREAEYRRANVEMERVRRKFIPK